MGRQLDGIGGASEASRGAADFVPVEGSCEGWERGKTIGTSKSGVGSNGRNGRDGGGGLAIIRGFWFFHSNPSKRVRARLQ